MLPEKQKSRAARAGQRQALNACFESFCRKATPQSYMQLQAKIMDALLERTMYQPQSLDYCEHINEMMGVANLHTKAIDAIHREYWRDEEPVCKPEQAGDYE